MRSVTGSAVLVAVLCSAAPVWAQQAAPPAQQPPVIVTRGEASLKRAPDQAFVSIAAEARAASPAEAQRNAADSMKAVQAALAKAGVGNDAIRTTGYSMQPDMDTRAAARASEATSSATNWKCAWMTCSILAESLMRQGSRARPRWPVCDLI